MRLARLQIHRPWTAVPFPAGSHVAVRVDRGRPELVALAGGRPVLEDAVAPELPAALSAPPAPANRLRTLTSLRDQGLTIAEAYEAKRAEIVEQL